MHTNKGIDEVKRQLEKACEPEKQIEISEQIEPLPLQAEIQTPEPYPIESLGPILSPLANKIIKVIKAPDAIAGNSLLAAAALAVQGFKNSDSRFILQPVFQSFGMAARLTAPDQVMALQYYIILG